MSKVKNVGIIGLGVIGQHLIKEFKDCTSINIEAVCDSQASLAEKTANECGGVRFFADYQELLQIEEIDFVYVAVPPAVHFEVVMRAFAFKKHVLCEKPLANSEEEALQMVERARETGLIHAMHFPLAYGRPFETIKKMVKEQSLGEIKRITLKMHFDQWPRPWQQTSWIGSRKQGGFIREIMPHYLQIILHLFGSIKSVHSDVDYPSDPTLSEVGVISTVVLENGVKILVDGLVGQAEKEHIAFTVHGVKQSISLENWRDFKIAASGEEWKVADQNDIDVSPYKLIDELVKKLNGKEAFLINFEEGLEVQKALEKIIAP